MFTEKSPTKGHLCAHGITFFRSDQLKGALGLAKGNGETGKTQLAAVQGRASKWTVTGPEAAACNNSVLSRFLRSRRGC